MKIYKSGIGTSIFIGILTILMSLFFVGVLILPLITNFPLMVYFPSVILFGLFSGIFIYNYIKTSYYKVVITSKELQLHDGFNIHRIALKNIKGYTVERFGYRIYSNLKTDKCLDVLSSIQQCHQFDTWLTSLYKNVEDVLIENELENEILDNKLDGTLEDNSRKAKNLKEAISGIVLFGTCMIGGVFYLYEQKDLFLVGLMVIPLILIVLVNVFKSLIGISNNRYSFPSILAPLILSSFFLTLITFFKLDMHNYTGVAIPMIIITIPCSILLLRGLRGVNIGSTGGLLTSISIVLIMLVYSLGASLIINKTVDSKLVSTFGAKVLDKHYSGNFKGKGAPSIEISPWAKKKATSNHEVYLKLYESLQIDDSVNVNVYEGFFGMQWLIFSKRHFQKKEEHLYENSDNSNTEDWDETENDWYE